QTPATVALGGERGEQALAAPGADLDLRGDELAGDRFGKDRVRGRGRAAELLEARHQSQPGGVEQGELLLEPDREVRRRGERRACAVDVDGHERRSGQ